MHGISNWLLTLALLMNSASVVSATRISGANSRLLSQVLPSSSEMKPDQVNTEGWNKAWTNLVNDVEQSFVPSRPRLSAVEVELLVGNANGPEDDLTLSILNPEGKELVSVTQIVRMSECEHTLFLLPEGGIDVKSGATYRIRLSGGIIFGWKYIVGGYPQGAATFNGKPLLRNTRSTFLFRTFGSD